MNPLVDSFGRRHTYLRISVTDRCNLHCTYCQPSPLDHDGAAGALQQGRNLRPRVELLTFDEIEQISRIVAAAGVTKIRLTGGEPLVRKDLVSLVARLARIPGIETLGMTTNGVLLAHHARALKESGLTHLNVSLDTLRPERFSQIVQRDHYDDVIAGIHTALAVGFTPLKLNVVVMGGINDDELLDFVEFVHHRPVNVRFIEYMPFKFNRWNSASFVPFAEMKKKIEQHHELIPVTHSSDLSSVAKDFSIGGWTGTIGFITSMSEHFCSSCNRLRLTADGSLKSCLFHPAEINLRQTIRDGASNETIEGLIRSAVLLKPAEHVPVGQLVESDYGTMIDIGG